MEDKYAPAALGVLLGTVLGLVFDAQTPNSLSQFSITLTQAITNHRRKDNLFPVEMATGHSGGIS